MTTFEAAEAERPLPRTWQNELTAIARETGVTFAEMKSKSRSRTFVRARWAAFAMLRERGWSLPRIGTLFNRDHTTVMRGLAHLRTLEGKQRRGK